jgi:hypothetical protein
MKLSKRIKHILENIVLILFSFIYVFVIQIGLEKQNINLEKTSKATNVVENSGIGIHYGSKGIKSNVFFIKLKNIEEKFGVYRFSKNYNDLLQLVKIGDTITLYFNEDSYKKRNINIDLIQIEKKNKIILPKSEYEKKEGSLIYIGIAGLVANAIIMYYNRKKYLKTIKNKSDY